MARFTNAKLQWYERERRPLEGQVMGFESKYIYHLHGTDVQPIYGIPAMERWAIETRKIDVWAREQEVISVGMEEVETKLAGGISDDIKNLQQRPLISSGALQRRPTSPSVPPHHSGHKRSKLDQAEGQALTPHDDGHSSSTP